MHYRMTHRKWHSNSFTATPEATNRIGLFRRFAYKGKNYSAFFTLRPLAFLLGPLMPNSFAAGFEFDSGVREDWVDLRDQDYLPSLSVLRDSLALDPQLLSVDAATGVKTPIFGLRNQGASSKCVGFALANLIDIQRRLQQLNHPQSPGQNEAAPLWSQNDIVSADMLYHMAYFHDRYPDLEAGTTQAATGLRTMRSAIKGFYHHGACLDWPKASLREDPARWQSTCYTAESPDRALRFPNVEQAKAARNIGLGAYFRVASVLNHFHAALNDTGAVLTSANIHDGWYDAVPENEGVITWPSRVGKIGAHAFVLVGYDDRGFHVLNSWGGDWGGYKGQAGIALWPYADWARNVVDGWVLRLGVRAPSAFGVSIGEKGTKGLTSTIQRGSTPCLELVGHYMHLDDGFHVSTGSYPSFRNSWERTRSYLAGQLQPQVKEPAKYGSPDYRGMLIWIPGSLEGIKPAFAAAVQRKNAIKDLGLYPYSIFWCNSFVGKSLEVLDIIFESCKAQAGQDAAHLDSLIEQRVQGVGRAFWRDIEMSARRAIRGTGEHPHEIDALRPTTPGCVATLMADMIRLKQKTGCELHLVVEGAGVLVLHEMLSIFCEHNRAQGAQSGLDDLPDAADIFDTLHMVHPAIGVPRANRLLVPLMEAMNGEIFGPRKRASTARTPTVQPLLDSDAEPAARLYLPTAKLENSVGFGSYGKSILHLVARSFEDRCPAPKDDDGEDLPELRPPRQFLGMAGIADDETFGPRGAIYRLNRIETQVHASDRISQTELNKDPTITNSIFETIKARRTSD